MNELFPALMMKGHTGSCEAPNTYFERRTRCMSADESKVHEVGGRAAKRSGMTVLLILCLVIGGCSTGNNTSTANDDEPMVDTGNDPEVTHVPSADEVSVETRGLPTPPPKPNHPSAGKGTAPDTGDFVPVYEPLSNPAAYRELERVFKEGRVLESVSGQLNEEISLPTDITLSFRECGMVNAFYEPDKHRVSLCYEYVDFFERLFMQSGGTPEDAASGIKGAIYDTLYHEIGHALIHVLDLPVTGREEDVVDQLSTYILVEEGGQEGEEMVLNGAKFWYLLAQRNRQLGQGQQYWDEHSTNEQRFFNTICWLYGSNKQKYSYLVDVVLPRNRADKCPNEYARFVKGWRNVLAPFLKH
jgi:Putative metallopeptidase